MHTLKRGLVFAALLLGARLMLAAADSPVTPPANTPTLPTAVPAVGVWLTPWGGVFKSWADYRQDLEPESVEPGGAAKFQGTKIFTMETVIRRADTGAEVARIPYQGAIGSELDDQRPNEAAFLRDRIMLAGREARDNAFPEDQAQALAQTPPGDFLLAIYVNGVRASNVVQVRIDPAFDSTKAPTLQLAAIEPQPRADLGRLLLWVIGPTPVDPKLTTFNLPPLDMSLTLTVDETLTDIGGGGYSGPGPRVIASGERRAARIPMVTGQFGVNPPFDPARPHTYSLSILASYNSLNPSPSATQTPGSPITRPQPAPTQYDAAPVLLDLTQTTLGPRWDLLSPPGEPRPVAPPAGAPHASPASSSAASMPTPAMAAGSDAINAALQQKMSIMNFPNTTLAQCTSALSQLMHIKITIAPEVTAQAQDLHFNLNIHNGTMAQTLIQICAATGLACSVEGDTIVFHAAPSKTP